MLNCLTDLFDPEILPCTASEYAAGCASVEDAAEEFIDEPCVLVTKDEVILAWYLPQALGLDMMVSALSRVDCTGRHFIERDQQCDCICGGFVRKRSKGRIGCIVAGCRDISYFSFRRSPSTWQCQLQPRIL